MRTNNLLDNQGRVKIHLFKSIALSPLFTLILYFLILPFKNTQLYVLFYQRGSFPVWCTICFFISIFLLVFRSWEFKKDFKALAALQRLLESVKQINPQNAAEMLQEFKQDPSLIFGELTFSRFNRIMKHVETGSSWSETDSLVKGMGSNDAEAIESSYNWVKFLIWLIPILGFIGTVVGIGQAIGGFNAILTSSGDFNQMKGALGGITDSLAFAFDSTLVALLEDAIIMFVLSWVQKQGDDLVIKLDEVFTDEVLCKIAHIEVSGGGMPFSEAVVDVFSRFSVSAEKLSALGKLDSFEGTLLDMKNALRELAPILTNLQKKRVLHFKLQEVEEP